MGFSHPELLVPSVISFVLALYPLPWHLRIRNIATLSMIFWMASLNLVHIINCIVWSDNTKKVVPVWGDISSALIVGYNFGLPISHLVLAKQLESFTSLRSSSPLYDQASRRRHRIFDLCIAIGGPILGILLHLSMMNRRFYIVESYGPTAATLWDAWGVIGMAIVPILIAAACAVYTIIALVNIHLRRQQMLSMIVSDASVNKDQFIRLMFLTLAELATCGLRAIFNLLSFEHGPTPIGPSEPPKRNLSIIEQISLDQISNNGKLVLHLQLYTVVACSVTFFLCFATSTETKKFYWSVLYKVFPCLPPRKRRGSRKLGSMDSSLDSAALPTLRSGGSTDILRSTSPYTPRTPRDGADVSLQEMLGTPGLEKGSGWDTPTPRGYGEDDAERVFLAPYPMPEEPHSITIAEELDEVDKRAAV